MNGLLETEKRLTSAEIDPVQEATMIAFGMVYIPPF